MAARCRSDASRHRRDACRPGHTRTGIRVGDRPVVRLAFVGDTGRPLPARGGAKGATRGLATAAPMEMADAFQRIRAAFPRLWRGYMWYCLASAPIIFLGSVAYLAMGTWIMGHVLAVGGIVLSACMLAGGACGLRGWPHARTR